jgi:hypothetical protein
MTSIPLSTGVPTNAVNIRRVVLNSLSHTCSGDLHIVLRAPSGMRYTLVHRPNFMNTDTIKGQTCDYAGTYMFGDANDSWPPSSSACTGSAVLPPGLYPPYFGGNSLGTWPSANHGIYNLPYLEQIPMEAGVWRLEIFDWAAGDVGSIASWRLEGDTGNGPLPYFTGGVSTAGCVARISATSQPSASGATSCVIAIIAVEHQKSGLIFYGIDNTGFTPTPWGSGFLCVKSPRQRTPLQNSGGGTPPCSGTLILDWDAYQAGNPAALGNPFIAGRKVFVQGWYRDPPAQKVSQMSNAVELTYLP